MSLDSRLRRIRAMFARLKRAGAFTRKGRRQLRISREEHKDFAAMGREADALARSFSTTTALATLRAARARRKQRLATLYLGGPNGRRRRAEARVALAKAKARARPQGGGSGPRAATRIAPSGPPSTVARSNRYPGAHLRRGREL